MADAPFRLADLIDLTLWRELPPVNTVETTAFWTSGIVSTGGLFDNIAKEAQKTFELPYWNDLDREDPNLSSDDPTVKAEVAKVTQSEQKGRKYFINKGWGWMNLANELSAIGTATQQVKNRSDAYFVKATERRLVATANGILADNVANDSGDMVVDIAAESIATQTALTKFNKEAFIAASYTLGINVGNLGVIAVHPVVSQQMSTNNMIVYVPDSEGKLTIPTYMGHRVILTDAIAPIAGTTDGFKYVSVIFGAGAFAYGVGTPEMPEEFESDASAGNGAGMEKLWIRKTGLIHPFGFESVATPAASGYSPAELADAATWNRLIDRRLIPMAFIISN